MDSMYLQSRADIVNLELGLAKARSAIRKTANSVNKSNGIAEIYRHPEAFYQSYMEMEKRFKIYVYEEGEIPVVHHGPCKSIYSSEGQFIHEMDHGNNGFRTRNPKAAHVYFFPFSVAQMVKYLYKPHMIPYCSPSYIEFYKYFFKTIRYFAAYHHCISHNDCIL